MPRRVRVVRSRDLDPASVSAFVRELINLVLRHAHFISVPFDPADHVVTFDPDVVVSLHVRLEQDLLLESRDELVLVRERSPRRLEARALESVDERAVRRQESVRLLRVLDPVRAPAPREEVAFPFEERRRFNLGQLGAHWLGRVCEANPVRQGEDKVRRGRQSGFRDKREVSFFLGGQEASKSV